MKLIIIFGPLAVGKMTVGQELQKLIGYPLLHNHVTMDLLRQFFSTDSEAFQRLDELMSQEILKELMDSNEKGIIYTNAFDFNSERSAKFMKQIEALANKKDTEIFYVELAADLEERKKRNVSQNRLKHKPSKAEIKQPDKVLIEFENGRRFSPDQSELSNRRHLKIDNTRLSATSAAEKIRDWLNQSALT